MFIIISANACLRAQSAWGWEWGLYCHARAKPVCARMLSAIHNSLSTYKDETIKSGIRHNETQ